MKSGSVSKLIDDILIDVHKLSQSQINGENRKKHNFEKLKSVPQNTMKYKPKRNHVLEPTSEQYIKLFYSGL